MAGITLAQAKLYGLDDLGSAVADTFVTVNPIFSVMPFNPVFGNAYAYNRELAQPSVGLTTVDGSITESNGTVSQVSVALTTIALQSRVNGLIAAQGVGANAGYSPAAAAVASASKKVAMEYQRLMAVGDSANANEFDGITKLMADSAFSGQLIDKSSDDAALTLDLIDDLMALVTVGEGKFLMGDYRVENKIRSLLRALGGANITESRDGGPTMFNGIPFFRNDYLATDVDGVTAGNQRWVICGTFDDGTRTAGIAGLLAAGAPGLVVEAPQVSETKDDLIYRVKMYGGFAVHSVKSLAALKSVTV